MSELTKVAAIVAMDESRVIGSNGTLPWHVPADMAHFRELTKGHVVVMGRKTWDSLPGAFRPLPGRINVVVSRNPSQVALPDGVLAATSPEEGVALARKIAEERGKSVWIIGGAELYRALLPVCDEVHLTVVTGKYEGDAWLPAFEHEFTHASARSGDGCTFHVYTR
jgi:dihydrofolate reductase